ncbi:MAG: DUF3638 domain-containing protein [Gammaproteobacteria bacterium]|nr:DUF3638 domain-containing protein [Gammaproteobacteria bacterium]
MRISEKHFAHICSEAYLAGAFELEGFNFKETTAFLSNYVETHLTTLPTETQKVCAALRDLAVCNTAVRDRGVNWDELLAQIHQKARDLLGDDFILLPGGWCGHPGHAMIYELRKTETGGLIFKIYNSGDGLSEHKLHLGEYDPVVSYEIPREELQRQDFETHFKVVMKKLMAVSDVAGRDEERVQSGSELYNNVIAKIHYLGGRLAGRAEAPTAEERKKHTRGQLAGTCAQNALHEMLKGHFSDIDEYKRFMYRFKAHAMECYVRNLKESGEFSKPEKKALLEKGIKSNLRLLNRKAQDGGYLFPDDQYKREELGRLSRYLVELSQVQKKKTQIQYDTSAAKSSPEKATICANPIISKVSEGRSDAVRRDRKESPSVLPETTILTETADLVADLNRAVDELKQLQSAGRHEEAIRRMESLIFTQLKLPENSINEPLKPPYATLDTNEKIQHFFQLMNELKNLSERLYLEHKDQLGVRGGGYYGCYSINSVLQKHINLHLMIINAHVFSGLPACKRQPQVYEKLLQKMVGCFRSKEEMLSEYGMASNKPIVDDRYEKICVLVNDPRIRGKEEIENVELAVLKETISQRPYLLKIGEELFEIQKKKEIIAYGIAIDSWNNHQSSYFREDSPVNPKAKHIFLKKNGLHAAYGFLMNMSPANENLYSEEVGRIQDGVSERETITSELDRFQKEVKSIIQFKTAFLGCFEGNLWSYSFENERLCYKGKDYESGAERAKVKDIRRRFEHASRETEDDLSGKLTVYTVVDRLFRDSQLTCHDEYITQSMGVADKNNTDSKIMLCISDKRRRELMLLRLVRETQIPLTLDYFSRNLAHLTDRNIKIYVEANLFQPGLLRKEILKNSDLFFSQFNRFVDSGLRLYKEKNSPTKESLFFIRISFLVFQYAARLDPERHIEKLDSFYIRINELIRSCDDDSVKRTLLKYRLMTADEITNLSPLRASEFFVDGLEACFAFSLWEDKEDKTDSESAYQYECAKKRLHEKLEKKSDLEISEALKIVGQRLKVDLTRSEAVQCAYPSFVFTANGDTVLFNVQTDMVYRNGMAFIVMPDELKTHPLLKYFDLSCATHCYRSETQRLNSPTPIWTVKHNSLEMQLGDGRCLIRGLEGSDKAKWYEVFAIDDIQARDFRVVNRSGAFLKLSATIAEHDTFVLLSCENTSRTDVMLVKKDQVIMKGERLSADGSVQMRECSTQRILCQHEPSQLTHLFSNFEPSKYIDVFYDETTSEYNIELSRYGLTFQGTNPSDLYCIFNGEKYSLKTSTENIVESGIPQLTLINDNEEEIVILPESQFLLASGRNPNSAYKQFALDVNDTIDDHIVPELIREKQEERSERIRQERIRSYNYYERYDVSRSENDEVKILPWRRSDSKKCHTVKTKNGELIPENSEQALYLAYIYLGAHQPDKAWQMLELCDQKYGGISGTSAEIEYLQWIIESLPYDKQSMSSTRFPRSESDLIENTPQVVACQLKALTFIAQLDPSQLQMEKQVAKPALNNDEISNHRRNKMSEFVDKTSKHIVALYERQLHFEAEGESVVQYALTSEERWGLLDYCKRMNTLTPNTQLEYQTLYVEMLQKELEILRRTHHPSARQKEKVIKQYLKEVDAVKFQAKSVGNARLIIVKEIPKQDPFSPPKSTSDIFVLFQPSAVAALYNSDAENLFLNDRFFDSASGNHTGAVTSLTDEITKENILQYFSIYISIAENKASPHFKKIKLFSERALVAYSKAQGLGVESPVNLLANVLYRISHNQENDFLNKSLRNYQEKIDKWDSDNAIEWRSYYKPGEYESKKRQFGIDQKIAEKRLRIEAVVKEAERLPVDPIEIKTLLPQKPALISLEGIIERLPPIGPEKESVSLSVEPPPILSFQDFLKTNHNELIARLRSKIEDVVSTDTVSASDPQSFFSTEEYQAGKKQYAELIQLRESSLSLFSVDEEIQPIKAGMRNYHASLQGNLSLLEQQILDFAKSRLSVSRLVDMESDVSHKLDMNKLLVLYLQNDMNLYRDETNLTDAEIQNLHVLLIQYIRNKTAEQQAMRFLDLFSTLENAVGSDKNVVKLQIAQAFLAKNTLNASKDTVLSAFQIYENILLKENQIAILEKLLTQNGDQGYSESIEKIIMGGGKSKVILPTLVQKKANGNNQVIISVPDTLLKTCYADLRNTSKSIFNQDAFIFEFNIKTNCTPEALKRLHSRFIRAIHNKSYMVTAGESIQSLELKYLDFLDKYQSFSHEKSIEEYQKELENWGQSVHHLDQMLLILQERGELIIDEAHEGLSSKKKLNYTIGEPTFLSRDIVHASISFYKFIYSETFIISEIAEPVSFASILKDEFKFTKMQYQQLCKQIAHKLIDRVDTPIKSLLKNIEGKCSTPESKEIFHQELQKYLLNQLVEEPEFIRKISVSDREILALYKAELSQFLPSTLSRKHLVNYGESHDISSPPDERAIAIPYRSNKVPKYGSNFGNEIEAVNYTIQSMLLSGIQKDLFIRLLKEWRESSRNESLVYRIDEDNTKSGSFFKGITGESFSDSDVLSEKTQERLYKKLKYNESVILSALESMVLGKIKIERQILHSDAYSYVDCVHSCQGVTGTPWNSSAFHQRLTYDRRNALGTDGYVVSAVIAKSPQFLGLDFDTTENFVKRLLGGASGRTRAIIDISATFQGIENILVAENLACYIDKHQVQFSSKKPKIKYILYFNEDDQLSAMPVSSEEKELNPVVIGSSDPKIIQQKLGSTPEELFTFYDQSHTVGADIRQDDTAKSIVLVDHTIQLGSFLQGVMRMRGLIEKDQTLDIVMPTKMEMEFKASPSGIFKFIDMMYENEKKQLRVDNFHAAASKIHNVIRNDFLKRILAVDTHDAVLKSKLFRHFRPFFIEIKETDIYPRFGGISKTLHTNTLLNEIIDRKLAQWESLLHAAGYNVNADDAQLIKSKLKLIVLNKGICEEVQEVSSTELDDAAESMKQQENEKQMQKQAEIQQMVEETVSRREKNCNDYLKIDLSSGSVMRALVDLRIGKKSLNTIFSTTFFDENLYVTSNFSKSYKEQKSALDAYLKPVHALYFTEKEGKLYCQLLTQQECREIFEHVASDTTGKSWISTTFHTVLAGKPTPTFTKNSQYQRLVTQARYFNGEFDQILQHDIDYSWLKERAVEKIQFFEKYIFPNRETSEAQMKLMKNLYSCYSEAVEQVAANPDITKIAIKDIFSHFSEEDVDSVFETAGRFNALITSWNEPNFLIKCESEKTKFGIYSSDFEKHINSLKKLKEMTSEINKKSESLSVRNEYNLLLPGLSKISMSLLATLQKKNNLSFDDRKNYFLLYAVSVNPELTGSFLSNVVNASQNNLMLRFAVLSNNLPSAKVSSENIDAFLSSEKQSLATLSVIASHSQLRDAQVLTLLDIVDKQLISRSERNDLLYKLVTNSSLSETVIDLVVKKAGVLTEEIASALLERDDIIDPNFYRDLIAAHPEISIKKTSAFLNKFAVFSNTEEHLRSIIAHLYLNGVILTRVIENKFCNNGLISQILDDPGNMVSGEHLVAALNNTNITFEYDALLKIDTLLIKKTEESRFSETDAVINSALFEMRRKLASCGTEVRYIKALCDEFKIIYQKANSPGMVFLREKIAELRSHTLAGGYTTKANAIENAVKSLALDDRAIVTLDEKSDLSVALAMHRHLGRSAAPKYSYGEARISREKAADTYNEFSLFKLNQDKLLSQSVVDRKQAASIVCEYNTDKQKFGRTGVNLFGAGTFSKEIIDYLDKYSKGEKCSFDKLKGKVPGKRLKEILAKNGLLDNTGCLKVEKFSGIAAHMSKSIMPSPPKKLDD